MSEPVNSLSTMNQLAIDLDEVDSVALLKKRSVLPRRAVTEPDFRDDYSDVSGPCGLAAETVPIETMSKCTTQIGSSPSQLNNTIHLATATKACRCKCGFFGNPRDRCLFRAPMQSLTLQIRLQLRYNGQGCFVLNTTQERWIRASLKEALSLNGIFIRDSLYLLRTEEISNIELALYWTADLRRNSPMPNVEWVITRHCRYIEGIYKDILLRDEELFRQLAIDSNRTSVRCSDMDECAENCWRCPSGMECQNTPGGYRCMCGSTTNRLSRAWELVEASYIEDCTGLKGPIKSSEPPSNEYAPTDSSRYQLPNEATCVTMRELNFPITAMSLISLLINMIVAILFIYVLIRHYVRYWKKGKATHSGSRVAHPHNLQNMMTDNPHDLQIMMLDRTVHPENSNRVQENPAEQLTELSNPVFESHRTLARDAALPLPPSYDTSQPHEADYELIPHLNISNQSRTTFEHAVSVASHDEAMSIAHESLYEADRNVLMTSRLSLPLRTLVQADHDPVL